MDVSPKGLMEILSHEGICLSPYLDSVGVWTIGVGITKYDGKDPRNFGAISLDQAMEMFKDRVRAYVTPVQRLNLPLKQHQFDALVSFCFNVGPNNLAKLCHDRTVEEIGEAIIKYNKPPEIMERRKKEQNLFQKGIYTNRGTGLVFPVSATHKPVYSKGTYVDVTPYFKPTQKPAQDAAVVVGGTIAATGAVASTAPGMPWWTFLVPVGVVLVGYILYRIFKRDKQVPERNGGSTPEGDLLRGDAGGQISGGLHPEEPRPFGLSEPVPPVHGDGRSD